MIDQFLADSINMANNYDYLDRLYEIYPIATNIRRNIDPTTIIKLQYAHENRENERLVRECLKLDLFPLKDSYVAFLRKHPNAIENNPQTINRIAGTLYQLGWEKLLNNITEPKEANRQMGSKFKEWLIQKNPLATKITTIDDFYRTDDINNIDNVVLNCSDKEASDFASTYLGYKGDKGIDFIARFNGKYIVGEAKFITDFGGHQNGQFNDAIKLLEPEQWEDPNLIIKIAILDGVPYIGSNNQMFNKIIHAKPYVMSALMLNSFCYSVSQHYH